MNERVVYHTGSFVPESNVGISIYDTALTTGEVITEVTRTFRQQPFRLREHLGRLYTGLAELRIVPPLTLDGMRTATEETLARNLPTESRDVEWQIIHYVSRGLTSAFGLFQPEDLCPTVLINCFPLVRRLGGMADKYAHGVNLVVTAQRVIPAEILSPQIKSRGRLDYLIARAQAAEQNPNAMGILLDSRGFLAEGTGTTVYVVQSGRILTPPGEKVLNGVTRGFIFELAEQLGVPIGEAEITVEGAKRADEMFVTSTVICLIHARSFEGTVFGESMCGPVTRRIRDAFHRAVGVDVVEQSRRYAECFVQKGQPNHACV